MIWKQPPRPVAYSLAFEQIYWPRTGCAGLGSDWYVFVYIFLSLFSSPKKNTITGPVIHAWITCWRSQWAGSSYVITKKVRRGSHLEGTKYLTQSTRVLYKRRRNMASVEKDLNICEAHYGGVAWSYVWLLVELPSPESDGYSDIGRTHEYSRLCFCAGGAGHSAWGAQRTHQVSHVVPICICYANQSQCLDGRILSQREYTSPW